MRAIQLRIKGNWAQFRKAETNNNPLSHDVITKTAMIGMIGAVIGIERQEMRERYPILCEGLLYSVQIENEVKKQSWGFTLRSVSHAWEKAPKQMEFIKNPSYIVTLAENGVDCQNEFTKFTDYCRNSMACYTPVLGLHNCPAEIECLSEGKVEKIDGTFETKGFLSTDYEPEMDDFSVFRIGFDKIPTYQNNNFWNDPERFVSIVYPSNECVLKTTGVHYIYNNDTQWCMI